MIFSPVLPEFNPVQQPLLNEKVLRDKRKKLRETFERIIRLYERENPETYKDLRKLELDYETKRGQLALYYDSVKVRFSVNFLFIYLWLFWWLIAMCLLSSSECRVGRSGQYPIAWHASRPIQYPYSGYSTSRGSAPFHPKEDYFFWVGDLLFCMYSK